MRLIAHTWSQISLTTYKIGICGAVLLLAAFFGLRVSLNWLILMAGGIGAFALVQWPELGLLAVAPAAFVVHQEFGTGSAVALNPVTLLVPVLLGLWILDMLRRKDVRLLPSRTNRPLIFFLLAGLLSLLIGNALWDPAVPRSRSFIIVQLAQWSIFAFSAGAFWLTGNRIRSEQWLRRLTFSYLLVAGGIAIAFVLTGGQVMSGWRLATLALIRAPFWLLLAAVAGGQLAFNRNLSVLWRLFLLACLAAVVSYAFFYMQEAASNWVSLVAAAGALAWLRLPRLRWPVVVVVLLLASSGFLTSFVYNFAGGDDEWEESGGSRLALIGRVVEVTMRNPITGLGPAAYRPYAAMKPLQYGKAFWLTPQINSHNNYVDLFSHVGVVGLLFFFWFATEVTFVGLRLQTHFGEGFAAGYAAAMVAAWAGSLILMLFADWMLPFVYNIGFSGFQASLPVWLLLGGLVTLEQLVANEATE